MKKIIRKIIAFLLVILLLNNCMENLIIKPFWFYSIEVSASLHINSGVSTCNYDVTATTSVTKISNYLYLQRLNTTTYLWVNEKNWSKSHDDHSAIGSYNYTLSKLGLYRTKLYTRVYRGFPYEEITVYSAQNGWA